jgi:phage gpG-like protein
MVIAELLGVEKVLGFLAGVSGKALSLIRVEMQRQAIDLTRYVKEQKLTGQVLHVQTGKLRRSVTYKMENIYGMDSGEASITGIVGTNLEYGRIHELGFNGTVSVREHLRRTKASFKAAQSLGWAKAAAKQLGSERSMGACTVRAHYRKMNTPERSFLRSSLADRGPSIREALAEAMRKAIQ